MHQTDTTRATTDVSEFISDLDAGTFEHFLSAALSQTASAVVDFDRKGQVIVTLDMERIAGTHQVRVEHRLKFTRPTGLGKSMEEAEGATVMHVGKYGALSLAQPSLLDNEKQQQRRLTD